MTRTSQSEQTPGWPTAGRQIAVKPLSGNVSISARTTNRPSNTNALVTALVLVHVENHNINIQTLSGTVTNTPRPTPRHQNQVRSKRLDEPQNRNSW